MRRSEINQHIREGEAFVRAHGFALPPFARWSPEQWRALGEEGRELREHGLGWDLTDFGEGDYRRFGLLLFTLRNGSLDEARRGVGRTYCEKVLIVGQDQITRFHYHEAKTEDIINRGGGTLEIVMHGVTPGGTLADTEVRVQVDGVWRTLPPGGTMNLTPGESITLPPRLYHQFTARGAPVLAGEVSTVNDDAHDNFFLEPLSRFPTIEEDEPPYRLIVGDYAGLAVPGRSHAR